VRFSALLFDLDGTLVDSHHEICLALEEALREVGFRLPFERVQSLVNGEPLEAIWRKLEHPSAPADSAYRHFVHSYRQHYMRDIGFASKLFPRVRETLAQLRTALTPARFSVVSNKAATSVEPLLARFELQHCFELALGCGETGLPPKPDPALLLHAAERLGAAPDACVMIGDTAFDVEAGKRAGMRTIAVTHGMGSRAELVRAEADYLIDDFETLARILLD
jgi:phosphoglycolate phosphatase